MTLVANGTAELDVIALPRLADHPVLRATASRVTETRTALRDLDDRRNAARAELNAAEDAAADGHRDDERLRRARAAIEAGDSDLRIADLAVTRAEDAHRDALADVARAVEQTLLQQHQHAARTFEAALAEARRHNQTLTELEDASDRLFSGGRYRKDPGLPLPRLAWRQVFGPGGLFDTFRACWPAQFSG